MLSKTTTKSKTYQMSSAMGEWFGGEYLVQVAVRRKLLDGGQRSYMGRKTHTSYRLILYTYMCHIM